MSISTAPNFTELDAGEIGGRTLAPGIYKWSSSLLITTDVMLSGGPDDVWIFQLVGNLKQANSTQVKLVGGASAKNIFWQVADRVTLGTCSHFEGIVLGQTMIAVNTVLRDCVPLPNGNQKNKEEPWSQTVKAKVRLESVGQFQGSAQGKSRIQVYQKDKPFAYL